jgi:hypothetical protein
VETRTFSLDEIDGEKVNTEALLAELKAKTGLGDGDIAFSIHEGGEIQKIEIVNGELSETFEIIEPSISLTLSDSSKFGKALEAIQGHAPEKDDKERVEEKVVDDFNAKLAASPVIQEILAALEVLKNK